MFAARDQENLTNIHQTAAANKPLNQGIRALQPKTPGLKTPFRSSKNDENRPFAFQGQKTGLRDGPGKLDKNAFVTPAGPRNRAPLGAKTTNAKAQPLKTPAPLKEALPNIKSANRPSTARRSARSKITIAPAEPVHAHILESPTDDDEPEYGYAPPPPVDLPDPPMDFEYDETYSQLGSENILRGYGEVYLSSPKDENGMSLRLKREEEEYKTFQEQQERTMQEQMAKLAAMRLPEPDEEVEAMIAAGPLHKEIQESNLDTLQAKSAAAALSQHRVKLPSVANKQTASSLQKRTQPASTRSTISSSSRSLLTRPSAPLPVSKNTIGFPKAKKTPSIIPSGQQMKNDQARQTARNQKDIDPKEFVRLYGEPPLGSEMWFRLKRQEEFEAELRELANEVDLFDDLHAMDTFSLGLNDTDDDVFQLPVPEA